jgi:DNA sulfur modification protein DndB
VPLYKTANIPVQDKRSLTSLISLYRVVKAISIPYGRRTPSRLVKGPSDPVTVSDVYMKATNFWDAVKEMFPQVAEVCSSIPEEEVTAKYRNENGGHLLFRPFCLVAFAKAVSEMINHDLSINDSLRILSSIEMDINKDPWRHVVWNPNKRAMINKNELLVRNLILHLAGQPLAPNNFDINTEYKKAVGEVRTSFTPSAERH